LQTGGLILSIPTAKDLPIIFSCIFEEPLICIMLRFVMGALDVPDNLLELSIHRLDVKLAKVINSMILQHPLKLSHQKHGENIITHALVHQERKHVLTFTFK
jgi:hypothetical protein